MKKTTTNATNTTQTTPESPAQNRAKRHELFTQIARQHLGIETLEQRNSDRLDFHEVAVWSVAAALSAAYEAGVEAARTAAHAAVDAAYEAGRTSTRL